MALFTLLSFVAAVINSFHAIPLDNAEPVKVEVVDDAFLRNFINNVTNESQTKNEACTDFYSYTCNQSIPEILKNYKLENNMKGQFSNLMTMFTTILKSDMHKVKSVNIDQKLYENCMKLGDPTSEYTKDVNDAGNSINNFNRYSIKALFTNMLEKFNQNIDESDWQQLDSKLASLGFGHTFFDINVINDPLEPEKKIILLEPPSMKEWNAKKFPDISTDIMMKLQVETSEYCQNLSKIFEVEKQTTVNTDTTFSNSEENSDKNNFWFTKFNDHENTEKLSLQCEDYQNLPSSIKDLKYNDDIAVLGIFNSMIKIIFDIANTENNGIGFQKLTIESWIKLYNLNVKYNNTSKFNWTQIFKDEFSELGITVNESEPIIVKNPLYFSRLTKILRWYSDAAIVRAIRLKFVSDNFRYYDWNWAQSIDSVDKSLFCFQESKLHGISEIVLQLLKKDKLQKYVSNVSEIKNNIVNALHYIISETQEISQARKAYLQSELRKITENIFGYDWDEEFISNYYDDFDVINNYFADIINYRRMLKNKNLVTLRRAISLSREYSLFSINEIEKSRNRFILHAILNAVAAESIFSSPVANKKIYYATYGKDMAAFLYSLLRENKFGNLINEYLFDRRDSEWLSPHVTYPPKVINCFIPKNIFKYGYKLAYVTVTEVFSMHIAYRALLNDSEDNTAEDFFRSYIQTQCGFHNKKMIDRILSNFEEFYMSLNCSDISYLYEKCNITAFQF